MNYLLMICGDSAGGRTPAENRKPIGEWVQENDEDGIRLFGRPLDPPSSAATVRVRDGETLVSDGPFTESKEFLAGFDLIEADHLDIAVGVAAEHEMAARAAVEVRPFVPGLELTETAHAWGRDEPTDSWMLLCCVNGIPEPDNGDERVFEQGRAWSQALTDRGVYVFGGALAPAEAATTVRVDGDETLLTDGPFVEAKEFIGGVAVLSGVTREQAIEAAAAHPLAALHRVEVRRFMDF